MKHLLLICTLLISGCATALPQQGNFKEWQEEVKLNDGRIIVVTQKKRCEGAYTGNEYAPCIAREAWLTINLPEFSDKPMVWHESLSAMILNISGGKLYVIGFPPTRREFKLYGEPKPFYIGFVWDKVRWKRIYFDDIPHDIYHANMLLEAYPAKQTKLLTLLEKEGPENNGNRKTVKYFKYIDPNVSW